MLLLTIRFFASAYTKNNNFQCSYDNKSKKEKSWLRFVVIDVHSIWKAVWVPQKNDWISSLRYNLQRSIMLFYEAETFSFSKNVYSIGPFHDPPIYSTIVYCMWRKKYW